MAQYKSKKQGLGKNEKTLNEMKADPKMKKIWAYLFIQL